MINNKVIRVIYATNYNIKKLNQFSYQIQKSQAKLDKKFDVIEALYKKINNRNVLRSIF